MSRGATAGGLRACLPCTQATTEVFLGVGGGGGASRFVNPRCRICGEKYVLESIDPVRCVLSACLWRKQSACTASLLLVTGGGVSACAYGGGPTACASLPIAVPACVLGRENHPLAGYRWALLPLFSPAGAAAAYGAMGTGGAAISHGPGITRPGGSWRGPRARGALPETHWGEAPRLQCCLPVSQGGCEGTRLPGPYFADGGWGGLNPAATF